MERLLKDFMFKMVPVSNTGLNYSFKTDEAFEAVEDSI
jgi:hypothetical protein